MINFDKITQFLDEYIEHYRAVHKFETEKLDMIIEDDIELLNKSLSKEQAIIMQTNSLEAKRLSLMKENGLENKTFKEIIEIAEDNTKTKLTSQFNELTSLIGEIKKLNSNMMEIVQRKLGKIREINNSTTTYDGKGHMTSTSSSSKILKDV